MSPHWGFLGDIVLTVLVVLYILDYNFHIREYWAQVVRNYELVNREMELRLKKHYPEAKIEGGEP